MNTLKTILLSILIILGTVNSSFAQTPIVTTDFSVSYTEPTRVVNTNFVLKELQHTTIYFETYDEGGVVLDAWTENITASSPSGGGNIVWNKSYPINSESKTANVWASATNPIGEGAKTGPVSKPLIIVIPDVGVPDMPFNLTVDVTVSVTVEGN